jgi:hypothetical protein
MNWRLVWYAMVWLFALTTGLLFARMLEKDGWRRSIMNDMMGKPNNGACNTELLSLDRGMERLHEKGYKNLGDDRAWARRPNSCMYVRTFEKLSSIDGRMVEVDCLGCSMGWLIFV